MGVRQPRCSMKVWALGGRCGKKVWDRCVGLGDMANQCWAMQVHGSEARASACQWGHAEQRLEKCGRALVAPSNQGIGLGAFFQARCYDCCYFITSYHNNNFFPYATIPLSLDHSLAVILVHGAARLRPDARICVGSGMSGRQHRCVRGP